MNRKGRSGSELGGGMWYTGPSCVCTYLQMETVLFVPANIFKARLERKMEELSPNLHGIDLEEQKLTAESIYLIST